MPKIIIDPELRILEAAKEIASESGLDVLSIRHIAKKCHIASGTIYNYFPNKESIIEKLMICHWDEFMTLVDTLIHDKRDLFIKIHELHHHYSKYTADFHKFFFNNALNTLSKDHTENALKNDYIIKLLQKITQLYNNSDYTSDSVLSGDDFADFVLGNFIALSTFHHYSYDTFEKALKKILNY